MINKNITNKHYNTIFVNGQAFNCTRCMSLKDLLIYMEFDLNLVIIEYNKKVIHYNNFDHIFFKPQDKVEVITIAGGG
uniref:Thiamine biosynthesis protein n=1 Tax=Melanthalia intermedia TaxID=172989 RepID=A0A345UAZ5_9FLOR|nr:Thiamine biosynthesis protein [Melanthalia intermedia]AXI97631.1 Thiamine biosynthesis protein [Melanthalia intermedia]